MKAEVKYWFDSGNVDLLITAETETEYALLGLLHDREAKWDQTTQPRQAVGLVFARAVQSGLPPTLQGGEEREDPRRRPLTPARAAAERSSEP